MDDFKEMQMKLDNMEKYVIANYKLTKSLISQVQNISDSLHNEIAKNSFSSIEMNNLIQLVNKLEKEFCIRATKLTGEEALELHKQYSWREMGLLYHENPDTLRVRAYNYKKTLMEVDNNGE